MYLILSYHIFYLGEVIIHIPNFNEADVVSLEYQLQLLCLIYFDMIIFKWLFECLMCDSSGLEHSDFGLSTHECLYVNKATPQFSAAVGGAEMAS